MDRSGSETPFSPHALVAERYELIRLIGQGGMGEVWEARHRDLDAPVAIKFAMERRLRDTSHLARFRREACALARLRFPHIVQVFDIGVHENFPFMVMELLVGETLRARLQQHSQLSMRETAAVMEPIARALAAIHGAGMVHRDVTPANVFLLEDTPGIASAGVKLLDFGIVKEVETETRVTVSGVVVGSPAYMSPEQARAEAVDARSDLWSLGALTYRAITGKDPFAGNCVTDVLFAICTGKIPSVGPGFANLEQALDAFFARALARNPDHRFQDAATMAKEFRQIADLAVDAAIGESPTRLTNPAASNVAARTDTTVQIADRPARAVRQAGSVARWARLRSLAALSGVLSLGALGGYYYARLSRASSSIREPQVQAQLSANDIAPALPAFELPRQATTVDLPAIPPTATETEAGRSPRAPRRDMKPRSGPKQAKAQLDPVFGLPVEP